VTRHGGQIQVESELGRGATFVMSLPVRRPMRGRSHGAAPGQRVVLVEDNPGILRSLADLLRDNGGQVIEADGLAALARIDTEPVDLVLTDLAMPGASGWTVATACRERFPATQITGFGDRLEPAKIERHGVRFVVVKPCTSTELPREVSALKAR
jgi:CheY-like chemotaxis protein